MSGALNRLAVPLLVALLATACEAPGSTPLSKLPPAPKLPPAEVSYLDQGRQLLRAGDAHLAHKAFIRSLRVEGETPEALTGAGLAAERQGLLNEAVRYFERARRMAPDSIMAHNNLGAVHYRMGNYDAARTEFQAALILSGGENRVAAHNLQLTDLAVRREEGTELPIVANPRPVQRLGSGEYKILGPNPVQNEG